MPDRYPICKIHRQRLAGAVARALAGEQITFVILDSEPVTIGWRGSRGGLTYVVGNAWSDAAGWKAAIEREFAAMLETERPKRPKARAAWTAGSGH